MPLVRTRFPRKPCSLMKSPHSLDFSTPRPVNTHPSLRRLLRNPHQILIHQRLLLEPAHHLVQHRGRDLGHVDARQRHDVPEQSREGIFENLAGGDDDARFRDTGFDGAGGLRGCEGEDAVFGFALCELEERVLLGSSGFIGEGKGGGGGKVQSILIDCFLSRCWNTTNGRFGRGQRKEGEGYLRASNSNRPSRSASCSDRAPRRRRSCTGSGKAWSRSLHCAL